MAAHGDGRPVPHLGESAIRTLRLEPVLEVDYARLGRGVGRHGIVSTYREDAVAGDGDCLIACAIVKSRSTVMTFALLTKNQVS